MHAAEVLQANDFVEIRHCQESPSIMSVSDWFIVRNTTIPVDLDRSGQLPSATYDMMKESWTNALPAFLRPYVVALRAIVISPRQRSSTTTHSQQRTYGLKKQSEA